MRWWLWLTPPAAAIGLAAALAWLPAPNAQRDAGPSLPAASPPPQTVEEAQPRLPQPALVPAPAPAGAATAGPASAASAERFGDVRDVGGGAVQAPLASGEALVRVAPPPKPAPEPAAPAPASPAPVKPVLLFQPVVEAAGVIVAEGRTIRLSGIAPVESGRSCTGGSGSWPCGMQARTALRQLVRGRAITCSLPDQQAEQVETECRVGGIDIAEWLVEQGWAEAAAGSPYERFAVTARRLRRGIHSGG